MLIVGAITINGFPIPQNSAKRFINTWAPGSDVPLFNELISGTSYGKSYSKMLELALLESGRIVLC